MAASHDSVAEVIAAARAGSGYERERALLLMANESDPRFLAASIERLNDWVANVRTRARDSFVASLRLADAATLLACRSPIEKLRRAKRDDHHAVCALYCQRVWSVLGREEVDRMIDGKDDELGVFAFWVKTVCSPEAWGQGVEQRLSHRNPRLRAVTLRWLQNLAPRELRLLAAVASLASRDAKVRVWVLRELVRSRPANLETLLRERLFDCSGTVRSICTTALGLSIDEQLRIARNLTDDSTAHSGQQREAIRLLAQRGVDADVTRLKAHRQTGDAFAQAICAVGLMRLLPQSANTIFEETAASLRGKALSRMLRDTLRLGLAPMPSFMRSLWTQLPASDRMRLTPLVWGMGRWECWCFAAAVCDHAETSAEHLHGLLDHLLTTYTYVRPSAAQAAELQIHHAALQRRLGAGQLQQRFRDDLQFAGISSDDYGLP